MDERISKVMVGPEATIRTALQTLDISAMRIALVADEHGRLLGVLTDGDVRRWILAGRGLDEPVTEAMNPRPVTASEADDPEVLEALMVERGIEFIPIVDANGTVLSAVRWTDLAEERGRPKPRHVLDMPVVIMAGGKGTRLAPYTKVLPKPLVPVGEKPVTEHIMDRFAEFGCTRFAMSVNYQANLIRAYFTDAELEYEIDFVAEPEPLGTGGSLSLMKNRLAGSPFFVTNCDILVDADYAKVVRYHQECDNAITLVASMKHVTIPYGVCEIADGGRLTRITEKPQFDFLVSTGFYVMEPTVLDDVPEDTYFPLTDLINNYLIEGRRVGVYPISEKSWFDIGQLEELKATLAHFGVE
jgi:dTDP-glucose pyrophosphorylase/CBS domain-containing protein